MKIGIVGHEAAKFTPETEAKARAEIALLLLANDGPGNPMTVISGACHLGGIDLWAIEIAKRAGIDTIEHAPVHRQWSGPGGFMDRNLKIAQDSDIVYCLVVKELPEGYTGMRFDLCYHCDTKSHVKSGGCWTVKQAIRLGKAGRVIEL